jgi:hypoxanthine phosphoribosyltransferase
VTAPGAAVALRGDPAHDEGIVAIGWAEIDGLVELIAERALQHRVEAIVGVARSGLVPAVMLSHRIGVRPLAVIDIARTESDAVHAAKAQPKLRSVSNPDAVQGRRVLLIDDIVGGGITMSMASQVLRDLQADVVTATLVVNQCNLGRIPAQRVVDIVGCVVHGWVVFPWEGKELGVDA